MINDEEKARYAKRAAELRALANRTINQTKRDAYLNMAQEYEQRASGAPGFRLAG